MGLFPKPVGPRLTTSAMDPIRKMSWRELMAEFADDEGLSDRERERAREALRELDQEERAARRG